MEEQEEDGSDSDDLSEHNESEVELSDLVMLRQYHTLSGSTASHLGVDTHTRETSGSFGATSSGTGNRNRRNAIALVVQPTPTPDSAVVLGRSEMNEVD